MSLDPPMPPSPSSPEAGDRGTSLPLEDGRGKTRGRKRPRRSFVPLLVLTVLVFGIVAVARTQWLAQQITQVVQREVKKQFGLEVSFSHVGFAWSRLAVRAEGIEVRHPTAGRLAHVDTLEIRPEFSSFFRKQIKIATVMVDGGQLNVVFRHGQLVNGPTVHQTAQQGGQPEIPFHDLAISDVRVRLDHDELGVLELGSVDVDVENAAANRLLVGVFSQGGSLRGARGFNGPIDHVEARAELTNFRMLRVAMARVQAGLFNLRVRRADVPLDLSGRIALDAEIATPLDVFDFIVPTPGGMAGPPLLKGNVVVNVDGSLDVRALQFDVHARVRGRDLALGMQFADSHPRMGIGDALDLEVTGNQDALRVHHLVLDYGGGTVTSPGTLNQRPLTMTRFMQGEPTLDGHVEMANVELRKLVHEFAITDFGKVLWNINAQAELHGELYRFGMPPSKEHPAFTIDVACENRNFRFLHDYYMRPQPPDDIIAIPRSTVTGQILIDGDHVRFRHLVGLFGPNNRSRMDIGLVQLALNHQEGKPDILIEGGTAHNVKLVDIGPLAGFPIAGEGSFTVYGQGPFQDVVIRGEGHLRDFHYNGLPLGDYDTRQGYPWVFRQQRVDFPLVDARAGRSTFTASRTFLDFNRYTLVAGAHIESTNFLLSDYNHMFKFEGDPVFAPYSGQTMPRCPRSGAGVVMHNTDVPCVDSNDPYERDASRPRVPDGTDTGYLESDVEFILGRPGDDPQGVMEVDFTGRNLYVVAFDEPISHFDTHLHYSWLDRSRGYKGTRQFIEYARGRFAGGFIDGAGTVDLGGAMHFTANVRNVTLADTAMVHGMDMGVNGKLNGSGWMEGQADAQLWHIDTDIHDLTVGPRNFGNLEMHLNSAPAGPPRTDPSRPPPPARWTMTASALNGGLLIDGGLVVPWRPMVWHDVDGNSHPDYDRVWPQSVISGSIEIPRTLDLVPLLPSRYVARLGDNPVASLRMRLDIERARLDAASNPEARRAVAARLVVDQLELGAQGMHIALAPRGVLGACVRDGSWWIDPAAATDFEACHHRAVATVHPVDPSNASFENEDAAAVPEAPLVGPEGTRFGVSGGGTLAGQLGLGVRGEIDLSRFAHAIPGVTAARGLADFRVNVRGDTDNPRLRGRLHLEHGEVAAEALPNPVSDLNLDVRLDGNAIVLAQANAQFGSSSIDMTGGVVTYQGRGLDRVEIPVIVRNLWVRPMDGVQLAVDADTQLLWSPADPLPTFRGSVTLSRARYTGEFNVTQDQSGQITASTGGGGGSSGGPDQPNVNLDLTIHTRDPIELHNSLTNMQILVAENERPFRITGTDSRMGVIGTLIVPQGHLFFRGSDFDVRRARITFDNPERIDPNFDLYAQTEVRRGSDAARNQWHIQLHAFGSAENVTLDMTSDPALSRDDIFLLLALRMTRAELDQITATGNLNASQGLLVEAVASATGLDRTFLRTVQQVVPIIDDFRITSAYSPSHGGTVPQVAVGRRLFNDWVRLGATVNTTDRPEFRGTVDVRLNNNTSVQLGYDNYQDLGFSSPVGNIGLDLRWRMEFE